MPTLADITLPAAPGLALHSQQGQNSSTSTQPTGGITYAKAVTTNPATLSGAPADKEFIPPITKSTKDKADMVSPLPPHSTVTPALSTKAETSHQHIILGTPSLSHPPANEVQSDVESARPSASGKMTTRPSNIDSMVSEKSEEGEYSVKCVMNLETNNQVGSSQARSCKYRERIRPSAQAVEGFHKNKIEGYYNVRSGF